jgi:hypothetical protein
MNGDDAQDEQIWSELPAEHKAANLKQLCEPE